LVFLFTSCDPKDTPETDVGDFVSAKYDPTTKSFILKYSKGVEIRYPAVIDNTTNPPSAGYALDANTYLYVANANTEGDVIISKGVNTVSQFIYDGMSTYYYWADEVVSKKPGISDVNPANYFYKILNYIDTQHKWSWITDDVQGLLAGFQGESLSFGYDLDFLE